MFWLVKGLLSALHTFFERGRSLILQLVHQSQYWAKLKIIFWILLITCALLHFCWKPTSIATFITRSPVDQSVENNQGCDWENYVADRCQPQHVDVKVPDSGHRISKTYVWILNSYKDIDTSQNLFYVNNKWTTPIKVREKTIPIVCP